MDGNSKSRFTSNWSPVPGKGTAQRQKSCDPAQRWGTDRAVESAHGTSSVGGVYPNNRLSEYTPWPEPAIRPGTPDFGGQLGQYHRELNNEILPALIDEYALDTEKLAYGGYSLGGLAAVMSLWETEVFASVFSLCGSFWYPGVADFIEEHPLLNRSARVYLQNGTREGKGHNNRLSEAAAYAQRVHTALRTVCGAKTVFDDNGHHDRQNERFCTVLRWVEQIL